MCDDGIDKYCKVMFPQIAPINCDDLSRQRRALEIAHDIRKFEIEMYWKRAGYFWAFQVAAFAGLGVSLDGDFQEPMFKFLILFVGLITSFAWYHVNKGSKFWQENWELQIDMLEERFTGNLYKTILCYANEKDNAYSVSRINQTVSGLFALLWLVALFYFLFLPLPHVLHFNIELASCYLQSTPLCLGTICFIIATCLLVFVAYIFRKEWKSGFDNAPTDEFKHHSGKAVTMRFRGKDNKSSKQKE